MKRLILIFAAVVSTIGILAQNADIIDNLAIPDTNTNARVVISQSDEINSLIRSASVEPRANTLSQGWSVQVFSDNTPQAKDDAFKIENKIKLRLPNEYVRAERISPFWKVRVGQFETQDDAKTLRDLLIKEFPELKGGIYIVRFNINSHK